ncbi:MAG: hypothetical protein ACI828_002488 [Flavobacteriales bacterium]|jgi:hypothetical protein
MTTLLKTIGKVMALGMILTAIISCEKDEVKETLVVSNLEIPDESFDFDQFGRAHNDYLLYVHATGQEDPKARFEYGKSYVDPVFGSFDVGLDYNALVAEMPAHMRKVDAIINGTYQASQETVSPQMKRFLDELAALTHSSLQEGVSMEEFISRLEDLEDHLAATQDIQINMDTNLANDGASMMAIASILKYSIQYWAFVDGDITRVGLWSKIKRGLADAWGYVSAWVDNGDGSYSWDHPSALVNADCHSDQVYEN